MKNTDKNNEEIKISKDMQVAQEESSIKGTVGAKWSVEEILRELDIANTNAREYSNEQIQLSALINARKVREEAAKSKQDNSKESLEQLTSEVEIGDIVEDISEIPTDTAQLYKAKLNKTGREHSQETIDQFVSLKESRQQKIQDFELTGSIGKTGSFNKLGAKAKDINGNINVGNEEDDTDKTKVVDIPNDSSNHVKAAQEQTETRTEKNDAVNFYVAFQNFFSNRGDTSTNKSSKGILEMLVSSLSISNIKLWMVSILLGVNVLFSTFGVTEFGVSFLGITMSVSMYIMINTMILLFSFVLSFDIITNSINTISKKIMSADLYLSGIVVLNILLNVSLFFSNDVENVKAILLITTITLILLVINAVGSRINIKRVLNNFKVMSSFKTPHTISNIEDNFINKNIHTQLHLEDRYFYKNAPCSVLNKFMDNSFNNNFVDGMVLKSYMIMGSLAIILGIGGVALTKNFFDTFALIVGFLGITFPICTSMSYALPLSFISSDVNNDNAVIQGMDIDADSKHTNTITLYADSLFPHNTVQLVSIKTFSGRRIDEAIVDTASVLCETKSVLSNLFMEIIDNKKQILKPVDTIVYEDEMGISAWVDNTKILIGNRVLMDSHNVVIPPIDFEKQYEKDADDVIYVATSGVISAVFIVKLTANQHIVDLLNKLYMSDVQIVVKSVDYMITQKSLAQIFGFSEDFISILPTRLHTSFNNEFTNKAYANGKFCNDGSFEAYSSTIVGINKIMKAINTSKVIFYVNMIVSAMIFVIMAITKTFSRVNVGFILLYSVVWVCVSIIFNRRTK